MTSSEKRWLIAFCLIVLVITTIPYAIGFWVQGNDWRFTGFLIGVEDGNSYIAKMMLGSAGGWLFKTPYTAYPQNGFLAFLPYILLGKLAAPPAQHEQLVVLFQLFRWAGAVCMIIATYQFIAHFIETPRYRKLGTALATIGGGVGWLAFAGLQQVLWGSRIPLEFYSPETFGFLSIFSLPHLAMARALLLWGLLAYWQAYQMPFTRLKIIQVGLLWVILGFMQPMTVLIGWMLVVIDGSFRWILIQKKIVKIGPQTRQGLIQGLVLLGFSFPLVIYTAVSFFLDPFLKVWSQQNIILSPPVIDYVLAYGLTLPFLFLGFRKYLKEPDPEKLVLLFWIVLLPVLAYFPYNLQRRLPEGIWVAICIILLVGMGQLSRRWKLIGQTILYSSFIMTPLILAGSLMAVFQLKTPIFRPAEEIFAFEFIQNHSAEFPVVLAAYDTANAIPPWATVRSLIGHGPESIYLKELQPRVENVFIPDTTDDARLDLFNEFHVQYILWGPQEKKLGGWNPSSLPGIKLVYQNPSVQVFEIFK